MGLDNISIQALSDEEIQDMLKLLQAEQNKREQKKLYQLIDNFRKAFIDLKQENIVISYNYDTIDEIILNSVDNFKFT